MLWPGALSLRASIPASEPCQGPHLPLHEGCEFARDCPRGRGRKQFLPPSLFSEDLCCRVFPFCAVQAPFLQAFSCLLILACPHSCFLFFFFFSSPAPSFLWALLLHFLTPALFDFSENLTWHPSLSLPFSRCSFSWQVHLRNRPCVCTHGRGSAEETSGAGGLELWGWGLLPWYVWRGVYFGLFKGSSFPTMLLL